MENKKCLFCDTLFFKLNKKPSIFKKQKYCTQKCSVLYKNKYNNPVKDKKVLDKLSNENSKLWKGNNISYFTLHQWIRKKSNLDNSKCSQCGIVGFKFKNDRWSIEYCNISGVYNRDINDWKCLCRKCHREFDASKRIIETTHCEICKSVIETKYKNYVKRCRTCSDDIHRERTKLYKRRIRGF